MNPRSFHDGKIVVHAGDCMEVLREIPDNSIDAVVTDPPYHLTSIVKRFSPAKSHMQHSLNKDLSTISAGAFRRLSKGFMGKVWDGGDIAFTTELWAEVLRVLKPGGHMVCFGGTRTYHRMACAIEDAGFEIRDALQWLYGSGFPKSHDVSKGIDRAAGVEREIIRVRTDGRGASPQKILNHGQGDTGIGHADGSKQIYKETVPVSNAAREWAGWGTALKPACEIICLARKPLSEPTVAANVLRWGTGAINVDGCRVAHDEPLTPMKAQKDGDLVFGQAGRRGDTTNLKASGRFPANLIHDGSPDVLAGFPESDGCQPHQINSSNAKYDGWGSITNKNGEMVGYAGKGSAARYFYTAKADAEDRAGSRHPTVKPVDLIAWLVRLICPKNGTVLDPFAGTGTTGAATFREGCRAVLIEREAEYLADIERRMELLLSGPDERARKLAKADPHESLPLFGAV